MHDTYSEDSLVSVHFVSPVEGMDPEDGQLFLASRHRVAATWMRQDSHDTLFLDGAGTVVAGWDTDLVDRVVWRDGTSMSVALAGWQAQMEREAERRRALRETYPRAYHRWQPDEDEKLAGGLHAGLTVVEMMQQHGRARGAIMARLVHLGLITRETPSSQIGRQADPDAGTDAEPAPEGAETSGPDDQDEDDTGPSQVGDPGYSLSG